RQYAEGGYKSVIVSNFERLQRGERPTIYGDGRQALDYLYVDDVVAALVQLAEPEHDGVLVNLGSGRATDIVELTGLMLEVADSSLEPRYCPPDWTAGTRRVADPAYAAQQLGWRATTPLTEGLRLVWSWMSGENPHG